MWLPSRAGFRCHKAGGAERWGPATQTTKWPRRGFPPSYQSVGRAVPIFAPSFLLRHAAPHKKPPSPINSCSRSILAKRIFLHGLRNGSKGRSLASPPPSWLLESVKFSTDQGKWYPRIFLIMPDHIHGLFRFPDEAVMTKVIRDWKRWTSRHLNIAWQDGFFDHRLRQEESVSEKADYMFQNPVWAGLVADPQEWPHGWFADRN